MSNTSTVGFPMPWTEPVESGATYMFDPMHWPFPLSPLSESSLGPAFAIGFTTAGQELNTPILKVESVGRNWYHYERHVFAQPANADEARAMGERAEATQKPEIGRLRERWETEHLPALETLLNRLRGMEVTTSTPVEVAAMLDEVQAINAQLWTIHFRIAIPMLLGMQIFDDFYADLFEGGEGEGHALLLGVASKSIHAGLALYDLAQEVRSAGLEPLFASTPIGELQDALAGSATGRTFLGQLQEYLTVYGLRQDLFDLSTPTWLEDPAPALAAIRGYLQSGRDERAEYDAVVAGAAAAANRARAAIANYPEAVRGQFEGLLNIGRTCSFLQEEHNFYIDQQGLSLIRLFYRRVGERLEREGTLERADDIFFLMTDEIRAIFANPGASEQIDHLRSLVQRRRNEVEIARTMTPPPFIGQPPAGPPSGDDPMARALGRFFGGPPQESGSATELKGNPGSRGTVTGVARIARTLEEAASLQQGEVLVAITTMPAWTPLFGIAAAVVTETGGPLSHCAIVAREYGIPAVVGAHGATARIKTGDRITVNGGTGVVSLGA